MTDRRTELAEQYRALHALHSDARKKVIIWGKSVYNFGSSCAFAHTNQLYNKRKHMQKCVSSVGSFTNKNKLKEMFIEKQRYYFFVVRVCVTVIVIEVSK